MVDVLINWPAPLKRVGSIRSWEQGQGVGHSSLHGLRECKLHVVIRGWLSLFPSNHCKGAAAEQFGPPCGRQGLHPLDNHKSVSPKRGKGVTKDCCF